MITTIQPETPPLRIDEHGAWRVGDSRVLLELVVGAFQDGATPEEIADAYSTITLADAYAVIAYYLRHRSEVDAYIRAREQLGQEIRAKIESQQDLADIRNRILARKRGPN